MKLRTILAFGIGVGALATGAFSGCSDDTGTGGSGGGADLGDVIYEAEATDEALVSLLDGTVKDEPENAAVIDSPADGASVSPASPITFEWHAGSTASRGREVPRWLNPSGINPSQPRPAPGVLYGLLEAAFGNVPSAYAHGTPVNGPGYLLVLSTADNDKLIRVFTLDTEYTPDAEAWSAITGASGAITATVLSAEFEDNRILQGGGPWESEPVTFTIAAE